MANDIQKESEVTEIKKQTTANTNYFDNTLLLILNEKAYMAGLIDEKTKIAISNEIQSGERKFD